MFVKCKLCVFISLITWDRILLKNMFKAAGFEPRIVQL